MSFWRRREESLDREIQDYLDRQMEENVARGMPPDEARAAARRKLGPVVRVKEDIRAVWGWLWLERLWQDLRQSCRLLAKNPGFTLVAVLSLAIGVGANCAMFSMADMMLLRPLPVPQPRGVLTVGSTNFQISASQYDFLRASYPDYVDVRDHSRSFAGLTAFDFQRVRFKTTPNATPSVKTGVLASGNFFGVMGVQPELGRAFRPDEDQVPGRDAVVVLSHNFWEQEFAADPAVLGRTVQLNGIPFTVIGVLPAKFTGLDQWIQPAFYAPLRMRPQLDGGSQSGASTSPLDRRDARNLSVKGRLKPGVTIAQAQAEISAIAAALEKQYPATNRNQNMAVRTELQARIKGIPQLLPMAIMLMILAGAVLLVACANVAVLLTSRAPVRAREIALRLAIGAGRVRLIRQLITESLLLALAGGLAGIALGYAGVVLLRGITYPSDVPVVIAFQLDQRALGFSLAVALGSVLLFGLGPALQTTRTDVASALKNSGDLGAGRRRFWGRNFLVVAQVAVSFVLLTVATFMYVGIRRSLVIGPGFRTDHLLMMTFDTSLVHYSDDQTHQFFKQLVDRSRFVPGVQSAALSSFMPFTVEAQGIGLVPEGYQLPPAKQSLQVMCSRVSDGYFETMDTPIIEGRGFRVTDTASSPRVAVVNETFARHYWPGQTPVGRRFRLNDLSGRFVEIVGVARNSKYLSITESPNEFVYLPHVQNPSPRMVLMVATAAGAADVTAPLREVVGGLDADMPVLAVRTMQEFYDMRAIRSNVVIVEMVTAIGLMGMLLALIGLYGLVSYAVSRRTREIGIRMAIGAAQGEVLRMVLRQGFALTAWGLGVGLILSVIAQRAMAAAFPSASRHSIDVLAYPLLIIAALLVTMLAAYVPARRAARVDPLLALRHE
jgi:macrolide transport system ATP-binding/permease protein